MNGPIRTIRRPTPPSETRRPTTTAPRRSRPKARRRSAGPPPNRLRDAYWEFYFYEIRIVLKNDEKKAKDATDKERRLGAIAAAIKKLEDGQPDFGGKDLRRNTVRSSTASRCSSRNIWKLTANGCTNR